MAAGTIPARGLASAPGAVPDATAPPLAARLADALGPSPAATRLREARARLEGGASTVERIDLADTGLRIGELVELLAALPVPPDLPARVGDWGAVFGGRAAALASVRVVCATLRAGRPLLSESTYTEAPGGGGDTLFRPATLYQNHGPQRLPVCPGGSPRAERDDASASWFTPFVDTCGDAGSVPLHALHRLRNARLGYRIDYVADRLLTDPARLRELLHAALLAACPRSSAPSRFSLLCGAMADTDGAPRAGRLALAERGFGTLRLDRARFTLGGQVVGRAELVERMLLPLLAVHRGNTGRPQSDAAPGTLVPLLAGPVRTLMLAWTNAAADRSAIQERFSWRRGGLPVGGRQGGDIAFADRVSRRAQVPPTLLLSAPTDPFGLLPRRSRRLDYALVRELFRQVAEVPEDRLGAAVATWYDRRGPALSAAYQARVLGTRRTARLRGADPNGYAFDDAEEDMSGSDVGAVPELLSMTLRRACRVCELLRKAART